jgi:hypothetical protein
MRTALDIPAETLSAYERTFIDGVREHGWFDTHVFDDEGDRASFSYSTGFWLSRGIPEIILFSLPRDVTHNVLWDFFRDAEIGNPPPMGTPIEGIFGNARAVFLPVAQVHYEEHLGSAIWFYQWEAFPCLQLVWPDTQGRFPWERGFEERFRPDQPDLTENGWVSTLTQ